MENKEAKTSFVLLLHGTENGNFCITIFLFIFDLLNIFYMIMYGALVPDVLLQILLIKAYLPTSFYRQSNHASSSETPLCHGKII